MPLPTNTYEDLTQMLLDENALEVMEQWSCDFDLSRSPRRIDQDLVHASHKGNVLISRHIQLSDDVTLAEVAADWRHPYFFEHEQDHVPGFYLVECVRQMSIATSHFYFDIPFGHKFVINEFAADFKVFAELDQPLFVILKNHGGKYQGSRMTPLCSAACIVQSAKAIGQLKFDGLALARSTYEAIRGDALDASLLSGPINSEPVLRTPVTS